MPMLYKHFTYALHMIFNIVTIPCKSFVYIASPDSIQVGHPKKSKEVPGGPRRSSEVLANPKRS